jgi:hypothetical protein
MVFLIAIVSLDERLHNELSLMSPKEFMDLVEENPVDTDLYAHYLFQLADLDFFDKVMTEAEKRGYGF